VRQALVDLPAAIEWVGIENSGCGLRESGFERSACSSPESRAPRPDPLTWSARISGIENGCYCGEIYHNGARVADISLSVAGRHNLYNATAAIAACHACGVSPADAAAALRDFAGVDRRMSERGRCNGAIIVDDYGHHPTEIRTTLRAVREKYRPRRLICVFQPHQYSRTRYLLDDFGRAFVDADLVILPDIYAARDSDDDRKSVSAADLVARIRANGQAVQHTPGLEDIVEQLKREAREGDVIVAMGAGNICEVGKALANGSFP
jgi:UDP-N-acetylmuramate--alanine ligase